MSHAPVLTESILDKIAIKAGRNDNSVIKSGIMNIRTVDGSFRSVQHKRPESEAL